MPGARERLGRDFHFSIPASDPEYTQPQPVVSQRASLDPVPRLAIEPGAQLDDVAIHAQIAEELKVYCTAHRTADAPSRVPDVASEAWDRKSRARALL